MDPSRGGIGSKLNIARRRFKVAVTYSSGARAVCPAIFKSVAAKMARSTFVNGPARATRAISRLPSLKLNGSTGTGLAAPKITGEPESISIRGNNTLITGSIWLTGLRVNLPRIFAVGSPRRYATNPCATSCKIAEKIRIESVIAAAVKSIVVPVWNI